ncbi:MAG: MarR family transcriptional regulator [Ruminococcus flavefaciens]|nr:MarR family transcriptional regulator [Ruminococcus flavefaciens]MCM1229398.1 MarR family transcriptional regulator [Ruminococcus flavefaciens]
MIENKQLVEMIENIHLLRHFFIRRISEKSSIHFGQVAIMKTIEQNEHCTQATIAECLGVSPASVATSTKRLQKAGLITKTVDEDNQRCKRLSLTDKGRSEITGFIKIFDDYDKLIFKDFSEEEKNVLMGFLERIVGEMREIEGIDSDFSNPMELCCMLLKKMDNMDMRKET